MAGANQTGNANQFEETPNDAYKSLQRKLEASRTRERQYQKEAGATQRMEAQLAAFGASMEQILDVIHSNGLIDDEDRYQRAKAGFSARNSNSDAALEEIMEQLHEAETMWDDERLNGPRESWSL
jgi:LPS O-antigen subunit length determinant protein (WzzB/FepE family)